MRRVWIYFAFLSMASKERIQHLVCPQFGSLLNVFG
jgi:hypothetical protein